jgi:LAO/AO transport system kinase
MLVCEAAACDVVIVETVGVGQSEVAVAGMVDVFVLLIAPGGGDELQGVKRGIVELADLLVVNKADGDLAAAARRTATDYASALHIGRADDADATQVLTSSALTGEGVVEVWSAIASRVDAARASGALALRRAEQSRSWMWSEVSETLLERFRRDPAVWAQVETLEADVVAGNVLPSAAARLLLDAFG